MVFTRILLALLIITLTYAAPVFSKNRVEHSLVLNEALSDFYENIIDQVMLDVSEDVLSYLPDIISHDDSHARHSLIQSMDRNLNFMRASLLASVHPLVTTDIPQITGFDILDTTSEEITENMSIALPQLNQKISHQLGLIINAKQSCLILMRQATAFVEQPTMTFEWKLRQPFQLSIIRSSSDNKDATEWLMEKLTLIQLDLLNEFNDRTQEATQLILEVLDI